MSEVISEQKRRAILTQKQEFLKDCREQTATLEKALTNALQLSSFWLSNNYQEEMEELDLNNFSFSKEDLLNFMSFQNQLVNLARGAEVTSGPYQIINNRMK